MGEYALWIIDSKLYVMNSILLYIHIIMIISVVEKWITPILVFCKGFSVYRYGTSLIHRIPKNGA